MVRRIQVRGYKEEVIFIETHGERDKIVKLELNEKNLQETVKTDMFSHPKQLIAMQRAAESFTTKNSEKSIKYFYIMDIF